ncbi:MAG: NAD(P)H-hydrate dehydratase [Flavobacteriales bacterium]|nr:NAD(P)H-hydrate dehydratase [Flavobacteriales bacterium]
MKVLTAQQIRELDRFTIENEPISSVDLMERAATYGFYAMDGLVEHFSSSLVYVCGKGNNGGDGLVMARLDVEEGWDVTVIVLEHMEEGSADFAKNLYRLSDETDVEVVHVRSMKEFPEIDPDAVIIDAILGTGLSRPLEGLLADAVHHINSLENHVVSIDIPTGLFAEDNANNNLERVIRADNTITFHCPKLSFLIPETGNLVGDFKVVDIGLMAKEMNPVSPYEYVDGEELKKFHRQRPKFSHKGTFGHALLLAGSKGKMGAAQLATKACLRSGVGLVTAHLPSCGMDIMQVGVPEVMCSADSNENLLTELPKLEGFSAIGIGPGIGTDKDTANVLKRLLQDAKVKLVIDADGLNILSENRTWLSFLPKGTILTPHPKEFERLAGKWENSFERLKLQQEFSAKYGAVVVFKGAHTTTTTPAGQTFFNSTGNAGMATAGSGDVLTGIILGLLAQGYAPEIAAVMGVWLHGAAGDAALASQTSEALIASDIISNLNSAFRELAI